MITKNLAFLPFLYFQQTRLRSVKDLVFHGLYEWIPAIIILSRNRISFTDALWQFLIYYLAFISIYEIGYIVNDQLAFGENNGRIRKAKLRPMGLFCLILLRLVVFVLITIYTENQQNYVWYSWYFLLIILFATHNVLKSNALKCVTFCGLAFARFFSPVFLLIDSDALQMLVVPILLHYVLFRLITYMDSKNLLTGFDRRSPGFRLGFYLLMLPFSLLLFLICNSATPIFVNLYYFAVSGIFVVTATSVANLRNPSS